MLLFPLSERLIPAVALFVLAVSITDGKDVCDAHLSRIKMIPFEGNAGVDAHYDALKAAGKSAVRCLIENVTNTRPKPDPRSIPHWGTVVTTVGDTAVFMLEEITGVEIIKMLPPRYQRLYKEIGVYAEEVYLHDGHNHRRILQRKLRRWYTTTYLPSLRKAQHNKPLAPERGIPSFLDLFGPAQTEYIRARPGQLMFDGTLVFCKLRARPTILRLR